MASGVWKLPVSPVNAGEGERTSESEDVLCVLGRKMEWGRDRVVLRLHPSMEEDCYFFVSQYNTLYLSTESTSVHSYCSLMKTDK